MKKVLFLLFISLSLLQAEFIRNDNLNVVWDTENNLFWQDESYHNITYDSDESDPQTNFNEKVEYTYNLQNRLSRVETTDSGGTEVVEYVYNDAGIRVQKIEDPDGTPVVTTYLVDSFNHTDYAQVLEEWTDGANPDVTYTIGDDVIAQSKSGTVRFLLYDGHGSTRQLADNTGDIV